MMISSLYEGKVCISPLHLSLCCRLEVRVIENRAQKYPLLIVLFGVSLLATAVFFSIRNRSSQGNWFVRREANAVNIPFPGIRRVSLGDAKAAFDLGEAIFLDVRGAPYYTRGHIPGALNIPLAELPLRLDELSKNRWVITYCASPYEEQSASAARLLLDAGFTFVTPLSGGIHAWSGAGYPIEQEGGSP